MQQTKKIFKLLKTIMEHLNLANNRKFHQKFDLGISYK